MTLQFMALGNENSVRDCRSHEPSEPFFFLANSCDLPVPSSNVPVQPLCYGTFQISSHFPNYLVFIRVLTCS